MDRGKIELRERERGGEGEGDGWGGKIVGSCSQAMAARTFLRTPKRPLTGWSSALAPKLVPFLPLPIILKDNGETL